MSGSGRALLFDIDGTLADTDALHLEAFNQVFAPHGHVFDRARASKELMGFSNISISERFLPGQPPERQAAIMAEKEQAFRKLASGQIKPLAGLMRLLDRADCAGIPMVAVTNAPRLNAELMLSGLGITQRFKAVIIGDELPHGKPHPMPYLEGLRAVSAVPELSLAFEDSRSDWNPDQPRPWRSARRGRGQHGRDLRRSGTGRTGRQDHELVTPDERRATPPPPSAAPATGRAKRAAKPVSPAC
jgi:beta-phosphoglucomutase-like phosphatase (HAD superfamily)